MYRDVSFTLHSAQVEQQRMLLVDVCVVVGGPRMRDGGVGATRDPVGLEDLLQICSQSAGVIDDHTELFHLQTVSRLVQFKFLFYYLP